MAFHSGYGKKRSYQKIYTSGHRLVEKSIMNGR